MSFFRIRYKCPQIVENETDSFCFWDLSTDPHYRQPYEYYYCTLNGSNVFGNWTKQIKFHHYAHGKLSVDYHNFVSQASAELCSKGNILLLIYFHGNI